MSDDGSPAASPSKSGTRNNRKARRLAARQREAEEKAAQQLTDSTTNDVMEFMGTFQDGPAGEQKENENQDEDGGGQQLFYVDTKPGELPKGFVVREIEHEKRVPDYVGNEEDVQAEQKTQDSDGGSSSNEDERDEQDVSTVQAASTANNTAGETDNDNETETDAGQVSGLLQDEFDGLQDQDEEEPIAREAVRYFKEDDPLQICQRCGESGHSVRKCEHVQCNTCGKLDDHGTRACPLTMICFRCQSRGHHIKDCPVDLSKAPSRLANSQCSRCSSRLHSSSNCPYIWRVYIRAPNAPSGSSIPKIHFACYNCASAEHFGDDCKLPRAHPVKAIDRSAFTIDNNKIYRGAPAGRQSETDSSHEMSRDRLPRPNIVNGVRQDRPPPNAPKGPKGKGKMRKQTLEEEIQDLKDDDEEEDMWKRLNNNVNERTGHTHRGENRQGMMARGGAPTRRGRGSWEPFKNRPRGRDRSRSPERPERRQHMRFSDSDTRPPPPRNDSYVPPSRDDNRHDRKNEPRGPGGRQRSPDFPRSSDYRDDDSDRKPPALLDRISRGREIARDDRAYHSDSYQQQRRRYANDRTSGGRYRGGYV